MTAADWIQYPASVNCPADDECIFAEGFFDVHVDECQNACPRLFEFITEHCIFVGRTRSANARSVW